MARKFITVKHSDRELMKTKWKLRGWEYVGERKVDKNWLYRFFTKTKDWDLYFGTNVPR